MKKFFALVAFLCATVTLFAQENNNNRNDDMYFAKNGLERSVLEQARQERMAKALANENPVYAAGSALKESVYWQCAAIGSAAVGGLLMSAGANKAIADGKAFNGTMAFGYAIEIFAAAAEIVSIVKIHKAGQSLQIGAGRITYTF